LFPGKVALKNNGTVMLVGSFGGIEGNIELLGLYL